MTMNVHTDRREAIQGKSELPPVGPTWEENSAELRRTW
jgi:hypothetical protein